LSTAGAAALVRQHLHPAAGTRPRDRRRRYFRRSEASTASSSPSRQASIGIMVGRVTVPWEANICCPADQLTEGVGARHFPLQNTQHQPTPANDVSAAQRPNGPILSLSELVLVRTRRFGSPLWTGLMACPHGRPGMRLTRVRPGRRDVRRHAAEGRRLSCTWVNDERAACTYPDRVDAWVHVRDHQGVRRGLERRPRQTRSWARVAAGRGSWCA